MKWLRSTVQDEKGAVTVLVALSMVALLSAIALAVDVGMLVTARTEAQRVADLSALAGAGILAIDPDAEASARTEAIDFALLNTVQGEFAVVLPADVSIDLDLSTVTVQVLRTETRGAPIGTFFARIFGVNSVDITAVATAIAEPAGPESTVSCLLPIILPDRWAESESSPGNYKYSELEDTFDPEIVDPSNQDLDDDGVWDTYVPSGKAGATGYDDSSRGTRVDIHVDGGGGGQMNPSWYFPWTPDRKNGGALKQGPGGARYRARFTNCLEGSYKQGTNVLTEPGAMVGPTTKGFQELYDLDREVFWNGDGNGGNGCPYRPSTSSCDYTTPRIRPVPLFDPRKQPAPGRKDVEISNFGNLFVEAPKPGENYTAIWLGLLVEADDSEPPVKGLEKYIHLIK